MNRFIFKVVLSVLALWWGSPLWGTPCDDYYSETQCPHTICFNGQCAPCAWDEQCANKNPSYPFCVDGLCASVKPQPLPNGQGCTSGSQCQSGICDALTALCAQCTASNPGVCPSQGKVCGTINDAFLDTCVQCNTNTQCPSGQQCQNHSCVSSLQKPTVSAASLNASLGTLFSYSAQATPGPVLSWSMTGTLPSGLNFNSSAGAISGIPSQAGTFTVFISATNSAGQGSAVAITITVSAAQIGDPCTNNVQCASGVCESMVGQCVQCSATNQTACLSQGKVCNTINDAQMNTCVQCTSDAQCSGGSRCQNHLCVSALQVPVVSPATWIGSLGSPFNRQVVASNPPILSYFIQSGSLPGGLTLSPANGAVFGTPTQSGTFTAMVKATNAGGTGAEAAITIQIDCKANGLSCAVNGDCCSSYCDSNTALCGAPPAIAKGYVDAVDCTTIRGWACDGTTNPSTLSFYDGATLLGTALAGLPGGNAGVVGQCGDGAHMYEWTVPSILKDGNAHTITARIGNTPLWNSPVPFPACGSPVAPDNTPPTVTWLNLSNGQTLNQPVVPQAAILDPSGLWTVEFYVDDFFTTHLTSQGLYFAPDPQSPWSTSSLSTGSHQLLIRAYDNAPAHNHVDAIVTVFIPPVQTNRSPMAISQTLTVTAGTPQTMMLQATDPENDSLTYTLEQLPQHGTISGDPPNLLFSPAPGYSGGDAFTFRAFDGHSYSTPGTMTLSISNPAGQAPTVELTSLSDNDVINAGAPLTITGKINKADSAVKSVLVFDGTTDLGAATLNPDNSFNFTWTAPPSGARDIIVKAIDMEGDAATDDANVLAVGSALNGKLAIDIVDDMSQPRALYSLETLGFSVPLTMTSPAGLDELSAGSLVSVMGTAIDGRFRVSQWAEESEPAPVGISGIRRLAVVRIQFQNDQRDPFTATQIRNDLLPLMKTYLNDASYGRFQLSAEAIESAVMLPADASCQFQSEDILRLLQEAGFPVEAYDHVMAVMPPQPCSFLGLARLAGKGSLLNGTIQYGTALHEFGHNLGLNHSRSIECPDGPFSKEWTRCYTLEYGDAYDTMGTHGAGAPHFNVFQKELLGWIQVTSVSNSGLVQLSPMTGDQSPRALKIPRRGELPGYYYLENRVPTGWDSTLALPASDQNGLLIRTDRTNNRRNSKGDLILSPASTLLHFKNTEAADFTLHIGQTFTDPWDGIRITPVAKTESGIQINVEFPGQTGQAPEVELTSVQDNDVINAGAPLQIKGRVKRGDSAVKTVRVFDGTTELGLATLNADDTFDFTWQTPASGVKDLIVKAVDQEGDIGVDEADVLAAATGPLDGIMTKIVGDNFGSGSRTFYYLKVEDVTVPVDFDDRSWEPDGASGSAVTAPVTVRGDRLAATGPWTFRSAATPRTTGLFRVATMIVDFPNRTNSLSPESVTQQILPKATAFFDENSYGKTQMQFDMLGRVTVDESVDLCDPEFAVSDWVDAEFRRQGKDPTQYDRQFYFVPFFRCGSSEAGGGGSNPRNWSATYSSNDDYAFVVAHELGHSLGLDHSNLINCGSSAWTTSVSASCENIEYGDNHDTMGNGAWTGMPHFNAIQKEKLGWISVPEITTDGTYTISPMSEKNQSPKALKIKGPKGMPGSYYLEYRQPLGFDHTISAPSVLYGALLHVDGVSQLMPIANNRIISGTHLIRLKNDYVDVGLSMGQTFTDPWGDIRITPEAASPAGLLVHVQFPSSNPVKITSPTDGSSWKGVLPIEATVSPDFTGQVKSVEFSVDGVSRFRATQPPYIFMWDTKTESLDSHTIRIDAIYQSGSAPTFDAIFLKAPGQPHASAAFISPNDGETVTGPGTVHIQWSRLAPAAPHQFIQLYMESNLRRTIPIPNSNSFHVSFDWDWSYEDNGPVHLYAVLFNRDDLENSDPIETNIHITGGGKMSLRPLIISQPNNQKINYGDDAFFEISLKGAGSSTFQWQKAAPCPINDILFCNQDFIDIVGAETSSYLLSNVTEADHRTRFRCIVRNASGETISDPAFLTVISDPKILQHPQDVSVGDGQTARFSVHAEGTPPLHYQWYRTNPCVPSSGESLCAGQSNPITGAASASYETPPLTVSDDQAFYNCRITNGRGVEVFSRGAIVTVSSTTASVQTPAALLTTLSAPAATVGDANVTVQITGQSFSEASQVLVNGIPKTAQIRSVSLAEISFGAAELSQTSSLSLSIQNPGAPVSNTLEFQIVPPPQSPVLATAAMEVPVGASIQAPAANAVSYQWSLEPMDGNSGIPIQTRTETSSLNLANLRLTPGTYRVTVTGFNLAGRASSPATGQITIRAPALNETRVYPNPWRADRSKADGVTFDHMPVGSTVRLFDVAGHHVKTLQAPGGNVTWDLTTHSGDRAASGLYIYLITDPQGGKLRGKVSLIR